MYGAADEASDGAHSQLSADAADDEEEEEDGAARSCYSSAEDDRSVNSATENSATAQCLDDDDDAHSQLQSPHQANVAAAAATSVLISDQYSVETLLANVQALLKLAMDSARHREQQANIKTGQ